MTGRVQAPVGHPVETDRIFTVPNLLSFARLLGVPLFLWLILGPEADIAALIVLAVSAYTDYLDGKLARAWHQTSKLGQFLDPVADRLYILAAAIGMAIRGIVPVWLVVLLVARDVVLSVVLLLLKRRGIVGLPVHFLGKAATFCLLYAFPLLLLGDGAGWVADVAKVVGWAFTIWGTVLYWWAGFLYVVQARDLLTGPVRTAGGPAHVQG